jgi:hypothetical protein
MTETTARFAPTSFASNIQNTRDSNIQQADGALYSVNCILYSADSDFGFEDGASFEGGLEIGELSLIPLDYFIYRRETVFDRAFNW